MVYVKKQQVVVGKKAPPAPVVILADNKQQVRRAVPDQSEEAEFCDSSIDAPPNLFKRRRLTISSDSSETSDDNSKASVNVSNGKITASATKKGKIATKAIKKATVAAKRNTRQSKKVQLAKVIGDTLTKNEEILPSIVIENTAVSCEKSPIAVIRTQLATAIGTPPKLVARMVNPYLIPSTVPSHDRDPAALNQRAITGTIQCAVIESNKNQIVIFWFREFQQNGYKAQYSITKSMKFRHPWTVHTVPFSVEVNDPRNPLYLYKDGVKSFGINGITPTRLFHFSGPANSQSTEEIKSIALTVLSRVNSDQKSNFVLDANNFFHFADTYAVWSCLLGEDECIWKLQRETGERVNKDSCHNYMFWDNHKKIIEKYYWPNMLSIKIANLLNAPLEEIDPMNERTPELVNSVRMRRAMIHAIPVFRPQVIIAKSNARTSLNYARGNNILNSNIKDNIAKAKNDYQNTEDRLKNHLNSDNFEYDHDDNRISNVNDCILDNMNLKNNNECDKNSILGYANYINDGMHSDIGINGVTCETNINHDDTTIETNNTSKVSSNNVNVNNETFLARINNDSSPNLNNDATIRDNICAEVAKGDASVNNDDNDTDSWANGFKDPFE